MHYVMLAVLIGFATLFWQELSDGPVLNVWKKVIALGIPFTEISLIGFYIPEYSSILYLTGVLYWVIAPACAMYLSARELEQSGLYRYSSAASSLAALLVVLSYVNGSAGLEVLGYLLAGAVQTAVILDAARMNST